MPRIVFKSKCPACNNNSLIYWHHYGCSSYSTEYLYDDGEVYCDGCKKFFSIVDCSFDCGDYNNHKNKFLPFDITRIENILSAVATFPGNEEEDRKFRRKLKMNIRLKWKAKYGNDPDYDDYY